MKITSKLRFTALMLCLALLMMNTSCQRNERIVVRTDKEAQLNNDVDSLSWALGFALAQNIAATGITPNREVLFQAICATLDSKQQPFTQEQTFMLIQKLENMTYNQQLQNPDGMDKDVKAKEDAYFKGLLESNPNVKKSDKGFYYEVLKEGKGRQGELGLVVVFDYKGLFTNGQVFDQTYGNREPITHVISDSMFPGLYEGLCMMRGGDKWRFYFPYEKAWGRRGNETVPPYTTVIYEVEVHDIHD